MSHLQLMIHNNGTALRKTASYYVIHVVVACAVAYAVTGSWAAATALSLLEPTVQAVAYFLHEKAWKLAPSRSFRTLLKTATYYVMHITVASCVAYAVTGDLVAAFTLSLLEPTVQMVFFFAHEKFWEQKARHAARMHRLIPICTAPSGCQRETSCTQRCALCPV